MGRRTASLHTIAVRSELPRSDDLTPDYTDPRYIPKHFVTPLRSIGETRRLLSQIEW